jgi:imidazolonepropionase-like amidohydrolase
MYQAATAVLSFLILTSCTPNEMSHSKAIIGAVLIDGAGGPPVSDSTVPVPAEADKINGAGKFIVPAPIDVSVASGVKSITAESSETEVETARAAGIAVIGSAASQAAVRMLLDRGANGFIGMIPDSEEPDSVLVSRLRDLRIFFAPALVKSAAPRNTLRLFRAGVPIAITSAGGDLQREIELLAEAGIPPLDVIVAATRNSAQALGRLAQTGTIEPGKRADLLLLSANPGEDVRNLRQVTLRMAEGEWVK